MKYIFYHTVWLLFWAVFSLSAQENIQGNWEGAIAISGTELKIIVHFTYERDSLKATIDIPQQGAKAVPLQKVSYNHPNISFELQAGPGLANFKGVRNADAIQGDFSQASFQGKFRLHRIDEEALQKSKAQLPYLEEEVSFQNGENTLAGTLTIPKAPGKHPAIILITGSGAQERDCDIVGFKMHQLLADFLSKNGWAVLRYDDRGIGASKGKTVDQSTTADFAQDVLKAVELLQKHPALDSKRIGLYGHSEGGIVAPMAASQNSEISFIISSAGPAVPGYAILSEQKKLISQASGLSSKEIKQGLELNEIIYETIRTDQNWDKLRERFVKEIAAEPSGLNESQIKNQADAIIASFRNPWFTYYLDNDPRDYLKKVRCPVLLLFGELDLQVPPSQNRGAAEEALKEGAHAKFTTHIFPKANHLFQEATNGSPDEYATLKKEFIQGYLDTILEWLNKLR